MAPVVIRLADPTEIDLLVAIDDDASRLYASCGLVMNLPGTDAFAIAERSRWLESARQARAFLAVTVAGAGDGDGDGAGPGVGFAALDQVDGQPYLDQLSVRLASMRRGIGRLLLGHALAWAGQHGGGALWLTTYAHLPYNRPYYERAGFVVVPEQQCGPGILHHLAQQRLCLPAPEQRVAMRRPV